MKKTILLLLVASTAALASEWGCGTLGAYARYDGNPLLNVDLYGTGYDSLCAWNSADGGITVNATGSEIHILGFNYNNAYSLYQDGVLLNRIKTDSTTVFTDITLATGLTGQHQYRIVTSSGNVQWGVAFIATVSFVGGGPVGTPPPAQPIIEACGDSNVGSGSGPDDSTKVDWWLLSQALGTSAQIYSASGAAVSGTISTRLAAQCPIKMVLAGNASPAVLVLEGGTQDAASALPIGDATTLGTFMGDYVYMIRATLNNAHPPTNLTGARHARQQLHQLRSVTGITGPQRKLRWIMSMPLMADMSATTPPTAGSFQVLPVFSVFQILWQTVYIFNRPRRCPTQGLEEWRTGKSQSLTVT